MAHNVVMCTNYTPATPAHLMAMPGLTSVVMAPQAWPPETFPGYGAPLLTLDKEGHLRCDVGRFGLVPRWCKDVEQASQIGRRTYNARSETVAEKPSYRAPWRERQFALVPMLDYFEPCWETGKAIRWRIAPPGGGVFTVAGLYEHWTDRTSGEMVQSFTLLTVNADQHPLMKRMHRPDDEKRMLVVVPPQSRMQWLQASTLQAAAMLGPGSDEPLTGEPAPRGVPPQQSLAF